MADAINAEMKMFLYRQCFWVGLLFTVIFVLAGSAVAQQLPSTTKKQVYTAEEIAKIKPKWPNPYLSFLPAEAEPDWDYWRAKMRLEGRARRQEEEAAGFAFPALFAIGETEPNDTQATGNFIPGFGRANGSRGVQEGLEG